VKVFNTGSTKVDRASRQNTLHEMLVSPPGRLPI